MTTSFELWGLDVSSPCEAYRCRWRDEGSGLSHGEWRVKMMINSWYKFESHYINPDIIHEKKHRNIMIDPNSQIFCCFFSFKSHVPKLLFWGSNSGENYWMFHQVGGFQGFLKTLFLRFMSYVKYVQCAIQRLGFQILWSYLVQYETYHCLPAITWTINPWAIENTIAGLVYSKRCKREIASAAASANHQKQRDRFELISKHWL